MEILRLDPLSGRGLREPRWGNVAGEGDVDRAELGVLERFDKAGLCGTWEIFGSGLDTDRTEDTFFIGV